MKNILFIDDDKRMEIYGNWLKDKGYNVIMVDTPGKALEALKEKKDINLIILDIIMPYEEEGIFSKKNTDSGKKTGVALFDEIRKIMPDIPIIVFTIRRDKEIEGELNKRDVERFLNKPLTLRELLNAVEGVLSK